MTPRHTLMALLVVVIWGLNFLAIDFGLEGVPPLLFLAMRFTVVVIPAIFFLKPPEIGWRNILLIGGFLSLGQFALLYIALALGMPPGLASLLHQSQVVLTVIVSVIVLRERPSRRQLIGIIVGMTGLAIVVIGHGQAAPWLPVVILLLGSLSWAIGNVLSRKAKAASSLSLVVWSGLVVPIPAFLLSLVFDTPAGRVRCPRAPVVDRHPEHALHRGGRVAHRLRHLEPPAGAVPDVGGGAVHAAGAGGRDHRSVDRRQRTADADAR